MYSFEKTDYGYKIVMKGLFSSEVFRAWSEEANNILSKQENDFSVFADFRNFKPIPEDAKKFLKLVEIHIQQKNLKRVAVIVDNPVTLSQLKAISHETGLYRYLKYIDSSSTEDWEQTGMDWLIKAVDPDVIKSSPSTKS